MSVLHALVLGIVQGLTEFLPISSSAHLVIIPWLLGWGESGLTFDVALHLGTLVAVLAYFWQDLLQMVIAVPRAAVRRQLTTDPMARLALILVVGSVPAGVAGLLAQDAVDRHFHAGAGDGAVAVIAALMIALALALYLAERRATHTRHLLAVSWQDGLIIGLAQALALLPGVSRSGSTITAGLFRDLKRDAAARFSFLLGVPAILGAGLLEIRDLLAEGLPADQRAPFAVGVVAAAVVGYLAIAFLLRYLQRNSTLIFVGYRLAVGAGVLALVLSGVR